LARAAKFAAAAGAALAFLASQPASAEPGIWVVKDKDSTIYLFGTVHVLKPETQWRTPKIDEAIAASNELWLELPGMSDEEMAAAMMPLVMKVGLSPDKPLAQRLTPEEYKSLLEAAKLANLPEQLIAMARPWFAAIGISASAYTRAGYDPKSGVEEKLKASFGERSIKAQGFETAEQQLNIFASMSEDEEMAFLRSTLKEYDQAPVELDKMVAQWAAGDVASLGKMLVDQTKEISPALYDEILAKRNANWAVKIREMLKGSGTVFIAVGAGHLLGPDSVQAQLKKKGIEAKRF
ncbi:MAG TPA: TraB/GumN family protein, partial [Hyphomonadaceae bacterium]|nr:TraB/GumN family protein [Hyphomonadaceae bacterium]